MITIKKIYHELKRDAEGIHKHYQDYKLFRPYQVKLYNWFRFSPYEWLPRFIYDRKILRDSKKKIAFFSVFGRRFNINIDRSDIKILFIGENVHARFLEYSDLMLENKEIDLAIGFDYLEHEKYMRFPIWLTNLFEPNESIKTIRAKLDSWNNYYQKEERERFCSFLSRHDYFGDRLFFYNEISKIGKIDCDGAFMHNNDDLQKKYNDNKFEYLQNYKFNLCPENSNYPGYCTEKLFEAIKCGCVPIYWGSNNNPEPEILNHKAILFLNNAEANDETLKEIQLLKENNKLFQEYACQKRFTDQAPDIVYEYFTNLEQRLTSIINNL